LITKQYEVFGITDTKKSAEDYRECVGMFVWIKYMLPNTNNMLIANGILQQINKNGLLRVIGNDKEPRDVDPNHIKNFHAKIDKFKKGFSRGEQNR